MNPPAARQRCRLAAALLATLATLAGPGALAQDAYPSRPITLVVGYPPGGSTDSVARPLADVLARQLGAKLVIDNVGGAGGALGAQKVVQATPDGYTLLLGASGELVTTQLLNPKQRYDGLRDFAPIGLVTRQAALLVTSRNSGIKTFDQFVQRVRQAPGKYSYATSGVGSFLHYTGEIMRDRLGLQITHVPYRGISTLGNDLAGGVIDFGFMGTGQAAQSMIDAGLLLPLAVTSGARLPLFPQVPSIGEHPDAKGYDLSGWFALMAPKGTPPAVVSRLQAALKLALADPQLRKTYVQLGGLPGGSDDDDLPRVMREDHERFRRFMSTANVEILK